MTQQSDNLTAEVLIIGAGLVGATLACALARSGVRTVVVDAADLDQAIAPTFDGRASAIALSSRRLLESIGLWGAVADEAQPMLDIRVSDGASPLFLHYGHGEVGEDSFGHMVENRILRRAQLAAMRSLDALSMMAPARLVSLERKRGRVEASLKDGRRIRAAVAVAADGRNSSVREDAGIRVTGWRYRQSAIVCTVAHEKPHNGVAHEHFLPAGPFAILPIRGNRSSIVWTEHSDLAPRIMALDEVGFLAELRRRFGDFLGAIEVVGPRWCYPLSLQYAERTVDHRLALVGDAAHAMHPIAGQGLNMGFRDVAALAEVLIETRRVGGDLGASDVLARYQRWRRFDNTLMLAMTDGLNRLFSNDIAPVRLARDIGLAAVNRMPVLKRFFMRHAMGTAGTLPRPMRGRPL